MLSKYPYLPGGGTRSPAFVCIAYHITLDTQLWWLAWHFRTQRSKGRPASYGAQ